MGPKRQKRGLQGPLASANSKSPKKIKNEILERCLFQNAKALKSVEAEFSNIRNNAKRYPSFLDALLSFQSELTAATQRNGKTLERLFSSRKRTNGASLGDHAVHVSLEGCAGSVYNSAEKFWAHLVKDWTAETPSGWKPVYSQICNILRERLPADPTRAVSMSTSDDEGSISLPLVVVPGCAQGRLVFELARELEGAEVIGVEVSRVQLMAADYIWNWVDKEEVIPFHPFADERSNNLSKEARCKLHLAPDVVPQKHPEVLKRCQLLGGDFLEMPNPGVKT